MLINNIDQLRSIIPTVIGDNLDNYIQALSDAELWLKTTVLGALFDEIERDQTIRSASTTIVAYKAYQGLIPKLDLVNTTNGFAVPSSDKLAPASRDRVAALVESISASRKMMEAFLYEYLEDHPELATPWSLAPGSTIFPQSLTTTLRQFNRYGNFKDGYDEWRRFKSSHRVVIISHIAPIISPELTARLIADGDKQSAANEKIIENVRIAFTAYFSDDRDLGDKMITSARNYIRGNIDLYPEYKNSLQNQPRSKAQSSDAVGLFC